MRIQTLNGSVAGNWDWIKIEDRMQYEHNYNLLNKKSIRNNTFMIDEQEPH